MSSTDLGSKQLVWLLKQFENYYAWVCLGTSTIYTISLKKTTVFTIIFWKIVAWILGIFRLDHWITHQRFTPLTQMKALYRLIIFVKMRNISHCLGYIQVWKFTFQFHCMGIFWGSYWIFSRCNPVRGVWWVGRVIHENLETLAGFFNNIGWWLTYPSERSWASSVGMRTFPPKKCGKS